MSDRSFTADAVSHIDATTRAVARLLEDVDRLERWGRRLAHVLLAGGRLLVAGNGGSAAHAQHLTSELVGRYQDERRPLSAIALHAETSALTAILNDYGPEAVFARQLRAHGRPGDVFIALSTSGRSQNLLAAVCDAHEVGLHAWAITGPAPNPLAELADDALSIDAELTAVVQEVHQLAVHLLCESLERALSRHGSALEAAGRG
jgi:D-sedoheptulose 7-phosphate isomerase